MIPVQLSLKGQRVLIYGAGSLALNKTKQFLNEGAIITIRSLSFLEEFKQLNVICEKKAYKKEDFSDFFMIYAATNDKSINQQIIQEARNQNILCGSVNKDENSTFHSVGYIENEDFILALSSKNRFPYLRPILNSLNTQLNELHPKMALLYNLRNCILERISKEDRKEYMHQLFDCEIEYLSFIWDSIQHNTGHLYVYHENDAHFKDKLNKDFLQKPYLILSIQELINTQFLFKIKDLSFTIHPLIIYYGFIYNKICSAIQSPNNIILDPLISNKETLEGLKLFYSGNFEYFRYIVHPRTNSKFEQLFNEIKEDNEELVTLDNPLFNIKENTLCIPLLTTNATHYHELKKLHLNLEKTLFENHNVQLYLLKNQEKK